MTYNETKVARNKLLERMKALNDLALKEKRDLTAEEQSQWSAMETDVDRMGKEIETKGREMDERRDNYTVPEALRPDAAETGGTVYRTLDGQEVRSAAPGQALPGVNRDTNVDIGRLIAGLIEPKRRSDWTREERDLLTAGVGSGGEILLPEPFIANLRATARNAMVVAPNATFVQMPSGKIELVGVDADPVATFKGETQELDEATPTFRGISLDAKKVGCYVRISKKLARASNAAGVITEALRAALANAIDDACLYGNGGVDLHGIANTTGIQETDKAGAGVTMDNIIDMHTTLLGENPPTPKYAAVLSTALQGYLWKLKDGEGQYLWTTPGGRPGNFDSLTWRPSNVVVGTTGSRDLFFLPENGKGLIIGYLADAEILVSETAANTSNSAFAAGEVWIRIMSYLDVALTRPAWFGRIKSAL